VDGVAAPLSQAEIKNQKSTRQLVKYLRESCNNNFEQFFLLNLPAIDNLIFLTLTGDPDAMKVHF